MAKIEAILLAGGRGTRLAPLTDTLPKPLVPILGKPILDYVLEHLRAAGVKRIAISVSYLGHLIEEYYGDGSALGLEISYLREPEMLGTGGWMKLIDWEELAPEFIVANADNLFWLNVPGFISRHKEHGAVATIAGISIPSETAVNYELLATNENKTRLVDYVDRSLAQELRQMTPEVFVSAGWYVMSPEVRKVLFDIPGSADEKVPLSMETQIWPALAKSGEVLGFYHGTEPWFDSGTHERLKKIEDFLS